jgi:hypothetical protein
MKLGGASGYSKLNITFGISDVAENLGFGKLNSGTVGFLFCGLG